MGEGKRQYTVLGKAWYTESGKEKGVTEEVTFGLYDNEDGGTYGEGLMRWHDLAPGRTPSPCLVFFGDAWKALFSFKDLIEKLKEADEDITPEAFTALLDECGFEDRTPVTSPYTRPVT